MSAPSRHADTARNVILNKASNDLWDIVSGHDPEIHNLNNRVWDRLDAMTVEIEQRCTDLSQASVAAALEAAAAKLQNVADNWDCGHNESCLCDCAPYVEQWGLAAEEIRALITPAQHDALAAHVAAEVAKARADEFNRGVRAGCYAALAHLDRHDYREDVTRSGLQDEILAAQIGAKP